MNKENIISTLNELRKQEKKKFNQSVDLIINLKSFDIKKESVNLFLELPYKIREVKICAFLNKKSNIVDSIIKQDFDNYKDKKKIKNLVKKYNFFISSAILMPSIASTFGRYLGPVGKMPSPQLGILRTENEQEVQETIKKVEKVVRIKSKEPSLKFCIGKEDMKDEEIADNVIYAYNIILNNLSKKKENIRNVMIKFSMTKPIKLNV